MYLCPESPQYQAFRAFSVFRGLGGLVRHRPASYRGDHIVPWRLIFAHPCPARICQKRGNAKKYPLPDSATSFNENNLAGTLRLPLLSHSCSNGSPQSPQITLTSRVARIMVPQQGQTSLRCSCSKGMQRLDRPTSSFIFISQARSPHHMVLM